AKYQAEQDLRHIRKWIVKLASPAMVAKRFPSILASYFDFGAPDVEHLEGGLRGILAGVPEVLAPWMIATCRGFAEHALEVNGARDVRMDAHVSPRPEPERGLPMADLRFDFRWRG
ncbi:MAG: hypothetical protein K8H88_00955, partial [Sandaracinaceae bacterium]|nr:hypothetical protein [Sandaracinaceae bacterium]